MAHLDANGHGDPGRRIRIAALFSLLLHVCLLPWEFGGAYRQVTLPRSLSVRIIHPPPSPLLVAEAEPGNPPQDSPAEALQEVAPEPQPLTDHAADPATENQQEEIIQSAEPAIAEDQTVTNVTATTALPDETADMPASASEVAVLLLIGANGEVLQIIWDQLPAISYETLNRMETRLREKKYPPSESQHTLTVVVPVPK